MPAETSASAADTPTSSTAGLQSNMPSRGMTLSSKKLSLSPHFSLGESDDSTDCSDCESECEMEGIECRVSELEGLGRALQDVRCGECGAKSLAYEENFSKRQSLYTAPCSICDACGHKVIIPFSSIHNSKSLVLNRKAVSANSVLAVIALACICCLASLICPHRCLRMYIQFTSKR